MGEYAPSAIKNVFTIVDKAIGSAQMSGIVGDRAHTYGYHRARNVLPSGDYSRQLSADRSGDGWAASALDIKMNAADMKLVTKRLIASAEDPDDPRMEPVREFFGTTNGTSVNGRRHNGNYSWFFASSDSSHLWHVHISFLRKYANDTKALAGVAEVITGKKAEDELPSVQEVWGTDKILSTESMGYDADYVKSNPSWQPKTGLEVAVRESLRAHADAEAAKDNSAAALKEAKACRAAIEEIKVLVAKLATGAVDADKVVDAISDRLSNDE